MDTDETSSSKKKVEKAPTENLTVTVDKKDIKNPEKGDDDPKPRIVLTFRSEKNSAKSSNMKIVSSDEKHEEAPRRSNRRKRWECDSETSPKKSKRGTRVQHVTDSESDLEYEQVYTRTTTRRQKKEDIPVNPSDDKHYDTHLTPQRLSRRIKPTAKILANEELRIGVESQNNARLAVKSDKSPEEGVRSRRQVRSCVTKEKKLQPEVKTEVVDIATTDDDSQSSVLKLKHLCELGLKAIDPEDGAESGNENRDEDDLEAEDLYEDDEIDDDPNVISKLLETDEDSDDDYLSAIEVKKNKSLRTRKSKRLTSGVNDSDQSSQPEEEIKLRPSMKRLAKPPPGCLEEYVDEFGFVKLKSVQNMNMETSYSKKDSGEPADGDEGSEPACPGDRSTIIAACYCETPSNVYPAPDELTEPTFCQAVSLVDGIRVGCSHRARLESPSQPGAMLRAGPRAPYVLVCEQHATQLHNHMCCPACGLFCTQGIFYQCTSGHLFHLDCGLPYNDSKASPGCTHCGVYSYRWQPANTDCAKVKLLMNCTNKRIFLPEQREQCTPAYLSFSSPAIKIEQGPIIPKDLLPSPPIQLTDIGQLPAVPPTLLCEAILSGETVDEILPKLVLSSHINSPVLSQLAGTCAHAAARSGHVAALYLLHYAGANLDATDSLMRTPLIVAITTLLKNTGKKSKENLKDTSKEYIEVPIKTEHEIDSPKPNNKSEIDIDDTAVQDDQVEENDQAPKESVKVEIENDTALRESVKAEIEDDKMEIESDNIDKSDNLKTDSVETESVTIKAECEKVDEDDGTDITEDDVLKEEKKEDIIKVIRYLLAAGCDANFPGPEGMTALHLCAQLGGTDAARVTSLLLAHSGTDVESKDGGGWTPLVRAAETDNADVVKVLLEGGANPQSPDKEGNLSVHWSALSGAGKSLLTLLEHAPHTIDTLNQHADTPLHLAARQGHYACVVILLARGARTDIENVSGQLVVEVCSDECQRAVSLNMQMAIAVRGKLTKFTLLSSDISNGREPFPIPCVNEVDDATLPDDFTYVTRHVTPYTIHIDTAIETMQGCECKDGSCSTGECSCCTLGVRNWYVHGRLRDNFPYHDPPMLFECNQTCRCNLRTCNNSVVSSATRAGATCVPSQVYRAGGARGWGLRARGRVARGACVAAYCGELLDVARADTRPADHYMFALDVKRDLLDQCDDKTQLCVDAAQFGSAARFINHSCSPNLAPVRVFTDTRDLRLPTVALFAVRDIDIDEEFTFDYGDKFWSVKSKWMKCECGHVECRYPAKLKEEMDSS